MHVVMFSTDRSILSPGSAAYARMQHLSQELDSLHIIVLGGRGYEEVHVGNMHAYPTNSRFRIMRIFDAIRLGKHLVTSYKLQATSYIVSAQDPFETGFAAWRVARVMNTPLHLQLHTNPFSPHFKGFLNGIRLHIARFLIPKATCVRVVRDALKNELVSRELASAERIAVIPLPVELPESADIESARAKCRELLPNVSFRIICIGRLVPEKRYTDALAVLTRVRESGIDAGMLFLGDGPEKKKLEQNADAHGVSEKVVFLGRVRDIYEYAPGADAFLHTSQFEGYGLAILEAAGAGVPVVTTNVGIATDVFTDGESAYICDVGDIDCLAKHIGTLANDSTKKEAISVAGMRAARGATWSEEEYLNGFKKSLETRING